MPCPLESEAEKKRGTVFHQEGPWLSLPSFVFHCCSQWGFQSDPRLIAPSPQAFQEGTQSCQYLDFSPVRPVRWLTDRHRCSRGIFQQGYGARMVIFILQRKNSGLRRFLGCLSKYSVEKAMATHSSPLAWNIPWTEEPGRLQSMGS